MAERARTSILRLVLVAVAASGCALKGGDGERTARVAQSVETGACTAVTATLAKVDTTTGNGRLDVSASAECGGAPAEFRVWVSTPGAAWTIVRDWSTTADARWDSSGAATGVTAIEVDARAAGSLGDYQATTVLEYDVTSGAPACSAVTLGASPPGNAAVGTPVTLTADAQCEGGIAEYRFWTRTADSDWSIARDYDSEAVLALDTGAYGSGVVSVLVDARVAGSTAFFQAQAQQDYGLSDGPCTSVALDASPPAAQASGDPIALTATAPCGGTAEYRFWARAPGGAWAVARDFDRDARFALDTRAFAPGSADVRVEARLFGADAVEATATVRYAITAARPCSAVVMWGYPEAAPAPGETVSLMAAASCGNDEEYRFWVRPPGGAWRVARDYAQDPTFALDTTDFDGGTATIEVDARLVGSSDFVQAQAWSDYAITARPGAVKPARCTAVTYAVDPAAPLRAGDAVVLTASAACDGASAEYRYWVQDPVRGWLLARDFASDPSFAWQTPDYAGSYVVEVDARVAGSGDAIGVQGWGPLALTGGTARCTKVSFGVDASLAGALTMVASASCTRGDAEYRFWIQPPGGAWRVLRDYAGDASITIDPSAFGAGAARVEVDARAAGSAAFADTQAWGDVDLP